jgi:hypothetical protein
MNLDISKAILTKAFKYVENFFIVFFYRIKHCVPGPLADRILPVGRNACVIVTPAADALKRNRAIRSVPERLKMVSNTKVYIDRR